jgi:CBS-domain-containing membrane protein
MSSAELMIRDPVVLSQHATVGQALDLLLAQRVPTLPVVDEDGRLRGLFGVCQVLGLLLPRVATWEGVGVEDLAYMGEGLPDLAQRLGELRGRPVAGLLDEKTHAIGPDTALMETLLLLQRCGTIVPVVEGPDERLVGVVTPASALGRIAGG